MAKVYMDADFCELFDENETHSPNGCEGFPREWVFGSWIDNKREFTIELNSGLNEIYMFFRIYFFQISKIEYSTE